MVLPAGGGDATEERRDDRDGMGGERSILVDVVQRGRATFDARRPRLAVTAQPSVLPQSCPWVGLTRGLGRDLSVFGALGCVGSVS